MTSKQIERIKKKITKIKQALAADKRRWGGFYDDSQGLRYLPPPEARGRHGDRPAISISPTQTGLASRFTEWTDFSEAAETTTSDHDLNKADLQRKNTELRLELATVQGLIMRRVTDDGVHQVKYRYTEDATTYVP